jgi:mono/diheme cytochrome c family protein
MHRKAITSILILAGTSVAGLMPAGAGLAADVLQGPDLGRPASPAAVAHWNREVAPDGTGLPPGRGTALQGEKIYAAQCLSCHGKYGLGDSGDQLAGAQMGLTSDYPEKTIGNFWPYATTLFDFIRRSMPMTAPQSLSDDQVYAVTAYLLYLNGIIGEDEELNAKTLTRVKMPNRNGFINAYAEDKNGLR